ncbi:MAG: hypothetical protein K2L22_06105 [Muribaculaceae bacterium]|nr:hypothetical protein [Muribaculaceae bacterium]
MNDTIVLEYAKANGLIPFAWFEINYPAYAVKVKYKYPTSDPADFRDRALLQMIDIGVPYSTACSLLMVNDPYQSILQRFKSDNPGPQLVHFDKMLNRLALTPIGRQRNAQIELAKDGVKCCFIDGFTGKPFPIDVVNLKDRFECNEIYNIPGGIYPFDANIEHLIEGLNARINDGKGRYYQKRLGIPEKARETSMSPLGPKWMRNLSIGIFLNGSETVRRIFCDDKTTAISPFGWLEELNYFRLDGDVKSKKFIYVIDKSDSTNVFVNNSADINQLILSSIETEYGAEFVKGIDLACSPEMSRFQIFVNSIDKTTRNLSRMLSTIENGIMSIKIPGMAGSMFIEVKASESINNLGHLRSKIDKSGLDWHEIIDMVRNDYPDNWRKTLIAINRHDLVFRHDMENFIKYGK